MRGGTKVIDGILPHRINEHLLLFIWFERIHVVSFREFSVVE
jgi:hypothetical protein